MLTAFDARLGLSQGRLAPSAPDGPAAPFGHYVFVLGDAESGHKHELSAGDYAEVRQAIDLTEADFVRVQLRLRVPPELPMGWGWVTSIRVGDTSLARSTCSPGRERVLTDLAANVSKLTGIHDVAIRLQLEEV